jgi:DNA-binding CsgD family transcriptional regulator
LDYTELILRIHAAAFDPSLWVSVVEDLRVALNARGALIHTPWVRSLEDYWQFSAQLDASELQRYAHDWLAHDLWAKAAQTRGLYSIEGLTYIDDEMVERRTFCRSAFFNDFLRHNDMDRMLTLNLHRGRNETGPAHTQLSVFNGVGKDAFASADVEILERIKPHLLIAARNYCALRALLALNATTEQSLDSVGAALFAIDGNGRLVHLNRLGDEVVREGVWLSCIGGRLNAGRSLADKRKCTATIRDAIAKIGATVTLEHASTGAQRILLASPIGHAGRPAAPVAGSAICLLWLLPDRPGPIATQRVVELFELTPAEARLLTRLAEEDELGAAATRLGISIHTARNQLKAILRKTGRRSQAQLLALLNRLSVIATHRPDASNTPMAPIFRTTSKPPLT